VVVADERDAANADLLVLLDMEAQEHFVALLRDDFALDLGEEVALLGVLIADLLHGASHRRLAQHGAGLDLDLFLEVVAVDVRVAVELDLRHGRSLAHDEAQHHAAVAALEVDLDVFEEAGCVELADVLRESGRRERLTGPLTQIREHIVFGDSTIAGHHDARDR
jgi:hypothetical protein